MIILPNQAGVALGLLAFAVASIVGIIFGVTLEIAILRGGISFLIFLVLGWLIAYLIYEEEKKNTSDENNNIDQNDGTYTKNIKNQKSDEVGTSDLKPPDEIDF